VAHAHRTYQPRDTDHSVLHAVIREYLEPFLKEVADRGDGHGLPRFVEQEFREFLTCGVLAHGFKKGVVAAAVVRGLADDQLAKSATVSTGAPPMTLDGGGNSPNARRASRLLGKRRNRRHETGQGEHDGDTR
jgi:hypothetical protein